MKGFHCLYVDPPWAFEDAHTGGSMDSGAGDKYPTLTVDHLERLPISSICAPSAVCVLWGVVSQREEALRCLRAWGFAPKTAFTWVKQYGGNRLGMGRWHRNGTEDLLVGIRGDVKPFGYQGPSWFEAPVGRHSAKPAWVRDTLIPACLTGFAEPRKVELFARSAAPGWTALGNEIDGQDIRAALRALAQEVHR